MTFADLGIPLPLWEAPIKSAPSYLGLQTCSLCQIGNQHCFRLGIGDDLVVPCPACQTENGLRADEKTSDVCRNCGQAVAFPPQLAGESELCVLLVPASRTRGNYERYGVGRD